MALAAAEAAASSPALADAERAVGQGLPNPPLPSEFLRWVRSCNAPEGTFDEFVPWRIEGVDVGLVRPGFAEELKAFPDVFRFVEEGEAAPGSSSSNSSSGRAFITFVEKHDSDQETRTRALASVMLALREKKVIRGWRDELFRVSRAFGEAPLCLIERAAAVHMGVRAYGVHMNGYVSMPRGEKEGEGEREEEEEDERRGRGGGGGENGDTRASASSFSGRHHRPTHLWVATRSASKPTWPGRLDHLVAGGQPASLSLRENLLKECGEEAGIPGSLASRARPVGVVSYSSLSDEGGAKRDVLFVFDLELPTDFVPRPCDGEVERFDLLPLPAAAALVARSGRFKDNCNLVLADFFVRHGVLKPDDAGYLELVAGLRPGLGEFARG
jgi:8-oxo-dGTP pyrophosphatase MutT (NUDIX family)